MQFERAGDGRYRCGDSLIVIAEQGKVERSTEWRGPGYRYTTVQVWDCIAEYEGILARGGTSGGEPRDPGRDGALCFRLRSRRQSHRDQPARLADRRQL